MIVDSQRPKLETGKSKLDRALAIFEFRFSNFVSRLIANSPQVARWEQIVNAIAGVMGPVPEEGQS